MYYILIFVYLFATLYSLTIFINLFHICLITLLLSDCWCFHYFQSFILLPNDLGTQQVLELCLAINLKLHKSKVTTFPVNVPTKVNAVKVVSLNSVVKTSLHVVYWTVIMHKRLSRRCLVKISREIDNINWSLFLIKFWSNWNSILLGRGIPGSEGNLYGNYNWVKYLTSLLSIISSSLSYLHIRIRAMLWQLGFLFSLIYFVWMDQWPWVMVEGEK